MKNLLFILCFWCVCYHVHSQNRLSTIYSLNVGDNITKEDIQLKKWVDSLLSTPFISDLQYSTSKNNDNKFVSFKLISKKNTTSINIPNTPMSLVVSLPSKMKNKTNASKTVNIEYSEGIQAYTHLFSPDEFNFSIYDYFSLGCTIYRLTNDQIVANTINHFIYSDFSIQDISMYDLFLKKINKKVKFKIPLFNNDDVPVDSIVKRLEKYSSDIPKLIFDVFIKDKNETTTLKNLNTFFRIMNRNIINEVNSLINLKAKINFEENQTLLISQNWMQKDDSIKTENTVLECKKIDYLYNREFHQMEINFFIETKDSLTIISGTERCPTDPTESIKESFSPDNKYKTVIKSISMIINRKELEISIETNDYEIIDMYTYKFY